MGELGYEYLRGSDSYCFTFSDIWLKKHGYLFLSDDLNNYPGQQYTQPGKDIFGCFSDALPDRWGMDPVVKTRATYSNGRKASISVIYLPQKSSGRKPN